MAAFSAASLGHLDEALQLGRRAVDLDPLNSDSWETLAYIELYMGQLDQAAVDAEKAGELTPGAGFESLSEIYLMLGRPQDALPEVNRVQYAPLRAFLCDYLLRAWPGKAVGRRIE